MTDPKCFLKAPQAPVLTNFEGGARAEETQFFVQNFPKNAQNAFCVFFFQIFACAADNLAKTGSFWSSRRAAKINLVDLKKVRQNV